MSMSCWRGQGRFSRFGDHTRASTLTAARGTWGLEGRQYIETHSQSERHVLGHIEGWCTEGRGVLTGDKQLKRFKGCVKGILSGLV